MVAKLAKDNQTLLVVNCAQTWQEVVNEQAYICPTNGSSYSYQPSRYFGVYHDRKVSHVANIEAVVDVAADDSTTIRWITGGDSAENYCRRAVSLANRLRPKNQFPFQVFILGYPQPTDFKKDSRGGMFSSKFYLDVSTSGVDTAGYLASKLSGKKWSDFRTVEPAKVEKEAASPGKYTPLANWFASQPTDRAVLSLSFQKIEEIINDELPPSAWEYEAWWRDKSSNTTHVNAYAWLDTGWQVADVSLERGIVSFRRSS